MSWLAHAALGPAPARFGEVLFAVALARRAPTPPSRRSLDRFVEEWLRSDRRPDARETWASLAAHPPFWSRLDDELRCRVARLLRRGPLAPDTLRRVLEVRLTQSDLRRADLDARMAFLHALGRPGHFPTDRSPQGAR